MILHFICDETGERINLFFEKENYNFKDYPDSRYIHVSRDDLDAIYQEADFDCYWYNDDLTIDHDDAETVDDVLPFH